MVLPATGLINEEELETNPTTMDELEFSDAPEGSTAIAYPSLGVTGNFPTCITVGPATWVQHTNFGAWFGPSFDFELDGNAGTCPSCFPPYDVDECFMDGDAGLLIPEAYTINNVLTVVPCPGWTGTPLGLTGQTAVWGVDIDIEVHNHMPSAWQGYFNLIVDWNQNGAWGDPGEHVVVNFWPIPNPFDGPISVLGPPNFVIGPNPGYVWSRFSITEAPVQPNWKGDGGFEDGETEDYLLRIDQTQPVPKIGCRGSISWHIPSGTQPLGTKTGTFDVGNVGQPGSLLDWSVVSDPGFGTWSFGPSSGTGLPAGSWTTVTATCIPPSQPNTYTGVITVCNDNDPTDCCTVSVSLKTPRSKTLINSWFLLFLEKLVEMFPFLGTILII
jgi:hypothetical protein